MIRSLFFGACALALLAAASVADAGFGHRRQAAAGTPVVADKPAELSFVDPGFVDPGFADPGFAPAPLAGPVDAGVGFDPSVCFEPGCGPVTVCPTNPCIKYRHKHAHKHRRCGCCVEPTYETVLEACSPETGLNVAIPVCLPVCCKGCPCETSRCTLFGCGQVRFDYACGCSVIARFTKRGDILVTYVNF